jgi:UDP-N-acetylglucosamine acyltransferase
MSQETSIHPTAVVAPGAELGVGVEIGPQTVVGPAVRIGDRTSIGPQVVIDGDTVIGEENVILGQASLGGAPQDFSYRGEATRLEIGDRNTVREFVTINRGTVKGGGTTRVGSDCLLMACCHVAHDCELHDHVVLANNVLLAGHVAVHSHAHISGAAAVHQFVTVGRNAYVGGMTRTVHDVPPFTILEGHKPRVRGVNVIGLKRTGFSKEEIDALREAYGAIWRTPGPRAQLIAGLRANPDLPDCVHELLDCLENTERGSRGRHRESLRAEFGAQGRVSILGEGAAE